ncbi:MAG: pyridoxamine 5'-phosphate oxidase family protein [Bacteroidales bacterium]|nr:pyridoxamine 5'-phosphate oxidase family protein [Bacteroidales bacterium]
MFEHASPPIDSRILEFIHEHHVLTMATSHNNVPWVANCFYYYSEEWNAFVFTSENHTRHMQECINNPEVSGSIVLETTMTGLIQGIQFSGRLVELDIEQKKAARKVYVKKFPVALLAELHLWTVVPYFIKMTHNRLGFGKKLNWESQQ